MFSSRNFCLGTRNLASHLFLFWSFALLLGTAPQVLAQESTNIASNWSGWRLAPLRSANGPILSVSASPDDGTLTAISGTYRRFVEVGSYETIAGAISVLDSDSGRLIRTIDLAVEYAAISADRRRVVGIDVRRDSFGFANRLFYTAADLQSQGLRVQPFFDRQIDQNDDRQIDRNVPITAFALSLDGTRVAIGRSDYDRKTDKRYNIISLVDRASGVTNQILNGHDEPISSIAFSSANDQVANGDKGGAIIVWDSRAGPARVTRTHRALGTAAPWLSWPWSATTYEPAHRGAVNALTFSPDGQLLASAGTDNALILWQAQTGHKLRTIERQAEVSAIAFSSDSKYLAAAMRGPLKSESSAPSKLSDFAVRVWDSTNGNLVTTLAGHSSAINALAFIRNGRHLASGGVDGSIIIWDTTTASMTARYERSIGMQSLRFVSMAPSQRVAATGGKKIILWDLNNCSQIRSYGDGHQDWDRIAFSNDGREIVGERAGLKGLRKRTGTLERYDIEYARLRAAGRGDTARINLVGNIAASTDGMIEVSVSGGGLKVADGSGLLKATLYSLPDGQWVAIGADGLTYAASSGAEVHLQIVNREGYGVVVNDDYRRQYFRDNGLHECKVD